MNYSGQLKVLIILSVACMFFGILFSFEPLNYVSLAILLISVLSKRLTSIVAGSWMKFARFLGTINTKIILTIIFYVFLTPIAFVSRILFKKNFEGFYRNKDRSMLEDRDEQIEPADFEKLW